MKKIVNSSLLFITALLLKSTAGLAQNPGAPPLPPQVPGELEKQSVFLNNGSASRVYYFKLKGADWNLDSLKPMERKRFYPLDSLLVRVPTNKEVMQYSLLPGLFYFIEWDERKRKWVIVQRVKNND